MKEFGAGTIYLPLTADPMDNNQEMMLSSFLPFHLQ